MHLIPPAAQRSERVAADIAIMSTYLGSLCMVSPHSRIIIKCIMYGVSLFLLEWAALNKDGPARPRRHKKRGPPPPPPRGGTPPRRAATDPPHPWLAMSDAAFGELLFGPAIT